jgi:hypothetical protein
MPGEDLSPTGADDIDLIEDRSVDPTSSFVHTRIAPDKPQKTSEPSWIGGAIHYYQHPL